MEVFAASFHYLTIFMLFGLLIAEMYLLALEPSEKILSTIARADILYGILAGLTLVSGLIRLFTSGKGTVYFTSHPAFWVKMTLFLAVALLSLIPTFRFLRWQKAFRQNGTLPDTSDFKKARMLVHGQLALLVLIPIAAVVMTQY